MSNALTLRVTNAGRQALINAENSGTLPLTITKIAIGAARYEPTDEQTELVDEIAQLDTFGGSAVADDLIHITVRDESTAVYSLGEFGLVTNTGVLFAVYSQTDAPILEKNARSMMLLSVDAAFTTVNVESLSFGGTGFLLPPGTEIVPGVLQLADTPEAIAGENDRKAMTARKTRQAINRHREEENAHDWNTIGNKPDHATRWPKWAEVSGKPVTFTPSAHNHSWNEITGKPQQATRWPEWNEVGDKPTSFPPESHSHGWDQVTGKPVQATRWPSWEEVSGKPATFPPSSHNHPWSEVTSKPATATRWPSWAEVSGKPTSFPASSHTHAWNEISGKPTTFSPSTHSHGVATTSANGFMSNSDKSKLNGIQSGAQQNPSTTSSRTSASTSIVLQAKAMNDHRGSGDHDSRYVRFTGATGDSERSFPVGHTVLAARDSETLLPPRNGARGVYISSNFTRCYTIDISAATSSSHILLGTWRCRGASGSGTASEAFLMQRIG